MPYTSAGSGMRPLHSLPLSQSSHMPTRTNTYLPGFRFFSSVPRVTLPSIRRLCDVGGCCNVRSYATGETTTTAGLVGGKSLDRRHWETRRKSRRHTARPCPKAVSRWTDYWSKMITDGAAAGEPRHRIWIRSPREYTECLRSI